MHPSKSKPTKPNWAEALKKGHFERVTKFPPESKSAAEISDMLKELGLPHGRVQTHRWIRDAITNGKVKSYTGMVASPTDGRLVRAVRYELL